MKFDVKACVNRILQILLVALLSFSLDYLIIRLTSDDSIWLGPSIEVVGSVLFSPVVGAVATLINRLIIDYLLYGVIDYSFVTLLEIGSVTLIGIIYRKLCPKGSRFGVREIVIFNFVQLLINACVLFLSTPPLAITLFAGLIDDWSKAQMLEEMASLKSYTFSMCVSTALIGTALIAAGTALRQKIRELGSVGGALRSILRPVYVTREYRKKAVQYSVGLGLSVALNMIDGVVSGHVLGMNALAASSIMFPLVSFSSFFSCITTSGCSTLCALAKGERKYERANQLFTLGLMATLFIGLLQTVLFALIKEAYFSIYPAAPAIRDFAEKYYQLYIFVPPFMALTSFLDNIVASEGDETLCCAGYTGTFVINLIASFFLARSMGMAGLALGTILGYAFYLLTVSTHFLKKSNTFRIRFWFSVRDIFNFMQFSLINNSSGLCMAIASATFTKAILQFLGSDYLVANTVLCAMLEVYEMLNGPAQGTDYLLATYTGERNKQGIKVLFSEAMGASLLLGLIVAFLLIIAPGTLLALYGVKASPLEAELIKCIRYSALGAVAAAVGGLLVDYYGSTGKPLWSCLMVIFRVALFPILFCVTFCLDGGVPAMGMGLLLAQICAILIFYGFVLVMKGPEAIPYMLDDPDFEKVHMNSFEYTRAEFGRICGWIRNHLAGRGMDPVRLDETEQLVMTLLQKTQEKNGKRAVLGECVLSFIDVPEIILKDNGTLFDPELGDARVQHHVVLSSNSNTIRPGHMPAGRKCPPVPQTADR